MSNLKIENYQQNFNFPELEEKVLEHWDDVSAFERSVNERPEDNPFVFYDGPPFATGLPHYGHILASTIKDVMPRYYTMKGHRVERVWGWDCHGLPIENIIEKELDLPDKQAIEDYGVENFNNSCQTTVLRYANEWKKIIHRLGRWVDMENDYKTMEPWYMESLWWVFKKLWERDLIFKGHKSMHVCPRCATPLSNFEVTQGYKEVKDISVYVEFKLKDPQKLDTDKDVYILAWTTTPWTVPGNVMLAFNPQVEYALFESKEAGNQYIAAKERIEDILDGEEFNIVKTFKGEELESLRYEPIFPFFKDTENAFVTITDEFVTTEEGTGIVHIAPAFGEDDYRLGQMHGIPLVQHVNIEGKFTEDMGEFAGLSVKPKDNPLETDIKLLKYLVENDALFKKVNIKHSYPHCWRCDTPLINYATENWFVKVTAFKDKLLENNQKINWIPEHIKDGRFGKWLEGAVDWSISRNRYWGTPLPIWQSDDGDTICIGSIKELEELSGQKVTDLHKHIIDNVTFEKDGKTYRRIEEVLDCWFESGAMPYASFHYPFDNKEKFEENFPAEFISEGQDQTRGWFYTLHVLSTALTLGDEPAIEVKESTSAFKNCVVTGMVLAEDGKKMSKRLRNYPDPMVVGNKYGIDSLRLYLMSSPVVRAGNLNFSEDEVDEIRRKVINIFFNVFKFYKLYEGEGEEYGFPDAVENVMDRWLVSITEELTEDVTAAMDAYDVVKASRKLMTYVDELSTWYVRRSRDRLRNGNKESLQVLRTAIRRWVLLMAPFAPFITEVVYQNLTGEKLDSVHLELLPQVNTSLINKDLEEEMQLIRQVVQEAHAQRRDTQLKLRQPLSKVSVLSKSNKPSDQLLQVLLDEINVKEVDWNKAETPKGVLPAVELTVMLTPELKAEGEAREIIRSIQKERGKAGTAFEEIVVVELPDWPQDFEQEIKDAVLASKLIKGPKLKIIRDN